MHFECAFFCLTVAGLELQGPSGPSGQSCDADVRRSRRDMGTHRDVLRVLWLPGAPLPREGSSRLPGGDRRNSQQHRRQSPPTVHPGEWWLGSYLFNLSIKRSISRESAAMAYPHFTYGRLYFFCLSLPCCNS